MAFKLLNTYAANHPSNALSINYCDFRGEKSFGKTKAGFIPRTQIYGVYADHFAHLGHVFSATNADLRRRDRAGAEYKHSYNNRQRN